jgi:hypothetical protein
MHSPTEEPRAAIRFCAFEGLFGFFVSGIWQEAEEARAILKGSLGIAFLSAIQ